MPVTKQQIRLIIADNSLNSAAVLPSEERVYGYMYTDRR